jgi:hypothetical protein
MEEFEIQLKKLELQLQQLSPQKLKKLRSLRLQVFMLNLDILQIERSHDRKSRNIKI